MFFKSANYLLGKTRISKNLLLSAIGSYLTYKLYIYIKNKCSTEEESTVQSEFRKFLLENNEICKNCDSYNRNILNKDDLKCWNCDELLNTKNHPTTTST